MFEFGTPTTEKPIIFADELSIEEVAFGAPALAYNACSNHAALLTRNGWSRIITIGDYERWSPPGSGGQPGIWYRHRGVFGVHAGGTALKRGMAHTPFMLRAVLEHGGSLSETAKAVAAEGFGRWLLPVYRRPRRA